MWFLPKLCETLIYFRDPPALLFIPDKLWGCKFSIFLEKNNNWFINKISCCLSSCLSLPAGSKLKYFFCNLEEKDFLWCGDTLLPPTRSDCWLTMAEEIKKSMLLLGLNENDKLEMRELRRMFKRRSIAMLPEKHPTVPNAHSKFEEIITAFVQVRSHNVVRTTMVDCHAMPCHAIDCSFIEVVPNWPCLLDLLWWLWTWSEWGIIMMMYRTL